MSTLSKLIIVIFKQVLSTLWFQAFFIIAVYKAWKIGKLEENIALLPLSRVFVIAAVQREMIFYKYKWQIPIHKQDQRKSFMEELKSENALKANG